jgi:hypothetical protein
MALSPSTLPCTRLNQRGYSWRVRGALWQPAGVEVQAEEMGIGMAGAERQRLFAGATA